MDIELSQTILNQGLTFLYVSLGIVLLVIGGFLAKLIYDSAKLVRNLNETTLLVNSELKPTLNELNRAIKSFNDIVQNTGEGVGNVKLGIENVINRTKLLSGNVLSGFLKGFMAVYTMFSKKK
jgi:predicted PurR-regulated permease PerM